MGVPSNNVTKMAYTLKQCFTDYVVEHVKRKCGHRAARRVEQTAAIHWYPALGEDFDCQKITRADFLKVINQIESRGRKPGTVIRVIGNGRSAMMHAEIFERIPKCPKLRGLLPDAPPPRKRVLTHDEQNRVLMQPMKRRYRCMFIMLFATGVRSEAIEQLDWSRVDLVNRTMDFNLPGVNHKNKRRPVQTISDYLLPRLVAWKAYRDEKTPDDPYVIGAGTSGRCTSTYHACKKIMVQAGIDEFGVCRHVNRHTVVTRLLKNNVTSDKAGKFVGDNGTTIEKNYAHLNPEDLLDDINKLHST